VGQSVEVELGESGDFVVFEIQGVETVIFDLSEGSDFLDAVVGESDFLDFIEIECRDFLDEVVVEVEVCQVGVVALREFIHVFNAVVGQHHLAQVDVGSVLVFFQRLHFLQLQG
jgi:hypothetical protein